MTLLRSPVFWLLVAVAVGVATFLIWRFLPRREWGFKNLVRNPELWDAFTDSQAGLERQKQDSHAWTDKEVAKQVEHFIFRVPTAREGGYLMEVLRSLEARTRPIIVRILHDRSLRAKLTGPTGTHLLPEAPIHRLCMLVAEQAPAEILELLVSFLDDPSDHVRAKVASVLASAGTPQIVEPVRKALSDPEEHVRSMALGGLQKAIWRGAVHESCKSGLLPDLERLIAVRSHARKAAKLLLQFNREQAIEILLSPSIFTPACESLSYVLDALAELRIPVPRERLLPLLAELQGMPPDRRDRALGEALRLLGQQRSPEDRGLLESQMTHPSARVAEGAAAGLLASYDLEGKLWADEDDDALSLPQRRVSAVMVLDAEVRNGGHSQYFVNSSGDTWQDAAAGLDAMGCTGRAAIFREALAKFGQQGPSTDRRTRQEQLAQIAKKDEVLFDSLDSRYYDCDELVEVFATRYAVANAEAFN